jgi:holo-[acyl-carrier protein] synthase
MIYGVGTDIVKVDRIRESLSRFGERFVRRILTDAELLEYQASRWPERFLAKRFAVKEAVVKALGLGFRQGLALNLIGVVHDRYGKPDIVYTGQALDCVQGVGITKSLLSISDEQDYAVAFVILMGEPEKPAISKTGSLTHE